MRLFRDRWREIRQHWRPQPEPDQGEIVSPFDAETICPGDPGWDIFQKVMETGRPVLGVYDSQTGEVVHMEVVDDDPEPR